MTDNERTYVQICQIAIDIQQLLDQYNTAWMPKKLKSHWKKMQKDAQKLEIIADRMVE